MSDDKNSIVLRDEEVSELKELLNCAYSLFFNDFDMVYKLIKMRDSIESGSSIQNSDLSELMDLIRSRDCKVLL